MITGSARLRWFSRGPVATGVALLSLVAGAGFAASAPPGSAAPEATAISRAVGPSMAVSVSSGANHACVVTAVGGVKCWGYNTSGQLGDGTTTTRTSAVDVVGLSSGVAMVSAGTMNTCALTTAGGVKCWGDNGLGQLGAGNIGVGQSNTPVDVVGLGSGVIAVGIGYDHACAVISGGAVKCYGYNVYGQLGDGTSGGISNTPVAVVDLGARAQVVALGDFHSCAGTTAGVSCWGGNGNGQLGNFTRTDSASPVTVAKLRGGVTSLSADGDQTCAVSRAGQAYCWGNNRNGYLAVGRKQVRVLAPAPVVGLRGKVTTVGVGGSICAAGGGITSCWGRNVYGELGDGTTTSRTRPVRVVGLPGAGAQVSAGGDSTCAVTRAGSVFCWGSDEVGQLGDGRSGPGTMSSTPVAVQGL